MKLVKAVAIFILSALLFVGIYAVANLNGWMIKKSSPEEVAALIEPHISVFKPQGDGPFPTILMFHGCGGIKQQQVFWANIFQSWGYAAVYVDSYVGRGIDRERALSQVCQGKELIGGERAADVLIAMAWTKQQPWADFDNLTLAGWSHGAWSIMDAFALEYDDKLPHSLNTAPDASLKDVDNLVLFYPYCGLGDQGSENGWKQTPSTIAITVEHDSVVGDNVCEASFKTIENNTAHFQHEVLANVDHAFDSPVALELAGFTDASPTQDDSTATIKARRLIRKFLVNAE